MPPLSKMTPFPTNASEIFDGAGGVYRSTMKRGGFFTLQPRNPERHELQ